MACQPKGFLISSTKHPRCRRPEGLGPPCRLQQYRQWYLDLCLSARPSLFKTNNRVSLMFQSRLLRRSANLLPVRGQRLQPRSSRAGRRASSRSSTSFTPFFFQHHLPPCAQGVSNGATPFDCNSSSSTTLHHTNIANNETEAVPMALSHCRGSLLPPLPTSLLSRVWCLSLEPKLYELKPQDQGKGRL